VQHTHVAALMVFSQAAFLRAHLNRIKKAFDEVYSGASASGNAGGLEILCLGVMISAASAARFLMSALDQAG
jgi:hypothetical protein